MITSDQASKRYPDGTVAHDRLSIVAPTGQVTVLVEATGGGGKTTAGARLAATEPQLRTVILAAES